MRSTPVRSLLDRFARRRWTTFAGGVALLVAAAFLARVPALLIGVALDALLLDSEAFALPLVPGGWLPATTAGQAALTVGLLGAAVVAESACTWAGRLAYERAALATVHDARTAVYGALAGLPMAFHDARDDGDVLSVLNDDVANLGSLFDGLRDGLTYGVGLVAAFAYMALLNWALALVLLAVPVALVAMGRVYARLLEPRYDAVRESVGRVNVRVRDAVRGLPTVKAYTREATERGRVADASADYRDAKWRAHRLRIGYDGVSWLVGTVGIWGLFLLGGYWVLRGPPLGVGPGLSAGGLLTFLIYAESFLDPTRRLAVQVVDRVESGQASARRVVEVLQRDDREDRGGDGIEDPAGRVTYEDVSFGYDGAADGNADDATNGDENADDGASAGDANAPTLADVSFSADPGDVVGVVGSTGAGKSTLLALLFRFYDPDRGTVRLDGRDVTALDPRALREHLAYVGQEPRLFPGTVAANVAYADPSPERERVVAAAERAGAHEFIQALPEGYDTEVEERGESLSGGQRQRLAIARALYDDPAVLVLDEATSHVDYETAAGIRARLAALGDDTTVFAIAHRLATVRDADRILVLDDGRVVERGTHDDLLERGGRYAALWRVQTGAAAADDAEVASP